MKKAIIVLCFMVITLCSNAKTKIFAKDSTTYQTHEIGIGYGFLSWEQSILLFGDFLNISFFDSWFLNEKSKIDYKLRAPATIHYKYYVKPSIAINTHVFYSFFQAKKTFEATTTANDYISKNHSYGMLFGASFYYYRTKNVQVYSGADIGFFLNREIFKSENTYEKRNDIFFSFQLNAAGVRFGNKFGGYIEFGYGSKGILNLGLSYKF